MDLESVSPSREPVDAFREVGTNGRGTLVEDAAFEVDLDAPEFRRGGQVRSRRDVVVTERPDLPIPVEECPRTRSPLLVQNGPPLQVDRPPPVPAGVEVVPDELAVICDVEVVER